MKLAVAERSGLHPQTKVCLDRHSSSYKFDTLLHYFRISHCLQIKKALIIKISSKMEIEELRVK